MSTEFASAGLTVGQLNAIVKKLGGHDMAIRLLRDELLVSEPPRSWHEEKGVVRFSVKGDGRSNEEWIKHLEGKGFRVSDDAEKRLRSFNPMSGATTTEVVVLKGMLFKDNDHIINKIYEVNLKERIKYNKLKLFRPNAELACLIRDRFPDKEIKAMGLRRIVVTNILHDFSSEIPYMLFVDSDGRRLDACNGGGDSDRRKWNWDRDDDGFAFVVSSSSSKATADKQVGSQP